MNIKAAIELLSEKRKIYHSESDFQFALAWEIKRLYPECEIRLEVPFVFSAVNIKGRIDIVCRYNGDVFPIELKYLKQSLRHSVNGEQFELTVGAHDIEMYSCIADIARIEMFREQLDGFHTGYAVWLTNDRAYWEKDYPATHYKELHAPDGSIKTGKMGYTPNPKTGEMPKVLKGYEEPIILNGSYPIKWNDYSDLEIPKGQFKYSVVSVEKPRH